MGLEHALGARPVLAELAGKVPALLVDCEDVGPEVALLDRGELADVTLEDLHLVVHRIDVDLDKARQEELNEIVNAYFLGIETALDMKD